MIINEEILKEKYRELEKYALKEGLILPFLIDRTTDEEYDDYRLDENERKLLFISMTEDKKEKLEEEWFMKRQHTINIMNDEDPEYNNFKEYYDDELETFLKYYPETIEDKKNSIILKIDEIDKYYKSGDYPKYIITQISEGTDKFLQVKSEYDGIEKRIVDDLKSREQDEKVKQDLWKIEQLHSYLETGENGLKELNQHLEIIREWDKLDYKTKEMFIDELQDCMDFTMDRWNTKDTLIKDIRKINKEYDNGVTDLEYLSCTNELLQPLYKIDNNLQRIQDKYKL